MMATHWSLEIRPSIGASLVAVLVVWFFALGVMPLLHVTTVHATTFLWLVLPFSILITYYGLKTAVLKAGQLQKLTQQGWLRRPQTTHEIFQPAYDDLDDKQGKRP